MANANPRRAISDRQATAGATCILLIGAVLRINHLWGQRPFWYDELSLLTSLMSRSYLELRAPLSLDQVAPYGFVVIIKWFGENFGFTELGVRLPVLLVSLVSLVLFYLVARKLLDTTTMLVALLLFATNNALIYYAGEVKQYAFDVTITVLIYITALPLLREWKSTNVAVLGAIGIVVVWISHPAAFVLGGIGLVLFWHCATKQQYSRAATLGVLAVLWLFSFIAHIWFSSALGTEVTDIQQNRYWADDFMPMPPTSVADIMWFWQAIVSIFDRPLGFETAGLATLAAAAGAWRMWQRSPAAVCMLLLPLIIALLASGLHLYPFKGRLLIFAGPALLLLIAEGIVLFGTWAWSYARPVWAIGVVLLLFHAIGAPLNHAISKQPYLVEGLPEVLAYMQDHAEPGDHVHLYEPAERSFRFYSPRFGLDKLPLTIVLRSSAAGWTDYMTSLEPLVCKRRVWLVFTHIQRNVVDDELLLLFAADQLGLRLQSTDSWYKASMRQFPGATAHLYDLSRAGCEELPPARSEGPVPR